ncbi:MAG: hypothetical protein K6G83_06965 [Lachnospiraceae bacterium]|nr:hypothetical protein [Lachnospiraceae bacterium]
MKIYDVFSNVREEELPLRRIEDYFHEYYLSGQSVFGNYQIVTDDVPPGVDQDTLNCVRELKGEGRKVAFVASGEKIIAVIGYKKGNDSALKAGRIGTN